MSSPHLHSRTNPETWEKKLTHKHTRTRKEKKNSRKNAAKIHDRDRTDAHAPLFKLIVFVRLSLCLGAHLDGVQENCACARNYGGGGVRACRSLAKKSLNLARFTSASRRKSPPLLLLLRLLFNFKPRETQNTHEHALGRDLDCSNE